MSDPNVLAHYSFLPWLRQGIANTLKTDPPAGKHRATLDVRLTVTSDLGESQEVTNTIQMVGPGDIVGINTKAIVRISPQDWDTDFEPNYLPLIEFYDEDFIWRYSPAAADATRHRIIPWLALIVLKENEFNEFAPKPDLLPSIEVVDPASSFPQWDQLWAWGHVHVNYDLTRDDGGDTIPIDQAVGRLQALLDQNPDLAVSRLLCPRKLDPKTGYHAFLLPSFETGRRAGLGEPLDDTVQALDPAWGGSQTFFPYYHRWYFHTADRGDFEYLARLIQPRPVDERVGIRDMDVSAPGGGIDGIDRGAEQPRVLGMEGALKSPDTRSTPWPQHYPEPFQSQLAEYINLADEIQRANPDTDPVITPPLYGRWHALRQRLELDRDGTSNPYDPQHKWLTELNLDPRHRAAAGLGTRIVQENQEAYMNRAWEQIGDVLAANQRLKRGQLCESASLMFYLKHLVPLEVPRLFWLHAPVHRYVLGSSTTVAHKLSQTRLPTAALSPEFRRIIRPKGPIARKIMGSTRGKPASRLLEKLATGEITAASQKTKPPGANTLGDVINQTALPNLPDWLLMLLRKPWAKLIPWFMRFILFILLLLCFLPVGGAIRIVLVAAIGGVLWIMRKFRQWSQLVSVSKLTGEDELTADSVDEWPLSPDFRITTPDESAQFQHGSVDSAEAAKFKHACADLFRVFESQPPASPAPPAADIAGLNATVMANLNPRYAIPLRLLGTIFIPPLVQARRPDQIIPVMAYPEFAQPMYKPLAEKDKELLMPNIGLIPFNTITLLETNQKFIEAYMVGLNHEMGRELLWREYPTDQRGSYFRQFWDVVDYVNETPEMDEKTLAETLKDIPEVHRWLSTSPLGRHNHREPGGDDHQMVLLIRADLLKRYPNTVIYAHRARWQLDEAGQPNKNLARQMVLVSTEAEAALHQRFPQYSAKVEPDIYFFGFDLTVEEAKGLNEDDPGWFFVLKERAGELRFGLDIEDESVDVPLSQWDDLSWQDIQADFTAGNYIGLTDVPDRIAPADPGDQGVAWHAGSDSANIAYILFQDPMMVAIHAEEMLKQR